MRAEPMWPVEDRDVSGATQTGWQFLGPGRAFRQVLLVEPGVPTARAAAREVAYALALAAGLAYERPRGRRSRALVG